MFLVLNHSRKRSVLGQICAILFLLVHLFVCPCIYGFRISCASYNNVWHSFRSDKNIALKCVFIWCICQVISVLDPFSSSILIFFIGRLHVPSKANFFFKDNKFYDWHDRILKYKFVGQWNHRLTWSNIFKSKFLGQLNRRLTWSNIFKYKFLGQLNHRLAWSNIKIQISTRVKSPIDMLKI